MQQAERFFAFECRAANHQLGLHRQMLQEERRQRRVAWRANVEFKIPADADAVTRDADLLQTPGIFATLC